MADKKIAVLGGSFNPVHYGHISLARNVVASGLAGQVWLSLSPRNPFKEPAALMDAARRLRLLEEAVAGEENLRVTDIELTLPEPSYTIDALDALSALHPRLSFTLLIGADNLQGFTRWKDWRQIIERYGLIVYPRGEAEIILPQELEPLRDRITPLAGMPLYPISSTLIREESAARGEPGLTDSI